MSRKQTLLERIQTEGAEAAYAAALDVCRDPKAPAAARAQASSTIMRAAGLFAIRDPDPKQKDASEMTYDELQLEINRMMRDGRERQEDAEIEDGEAIWN